MTQTILIVEDDPQIRDVVKIALETTGFATEVAGDGVEGLVKAKSGRFDLIILDVGLPQMDGLTMCRKLRESDQTPVIFLTAMQDEVDRVVGLEIGGDDYIGKPFSPRELIARIKAVLRRRKARNIATSIRKIGGLQLDVDQHDARFAGVPIALTAREMKILDVLSKHPGQVFAKSTLIDAVYGIGFHVSDRTLDSHVRNLRSKLSQAGCSDGLETLHGVGLRIGACVGNG